MSEIQELFDRQEITDVMHSYCRFVDLNLPEKQVECFTIDAIADYYGGVELVGMITCRRLLINRRAARQSTKKCRAGRNQQKVRAAGQNCRRMRLNTCVGSKS